MRFELETEWVQLGSLPPDRLTAAREELHSAVQVIAAFGHSLLPARSDDSHTSMQWLAPLGAFASGPMPAPAYRAAVRVADMSILLLNESDRPVASGDIAGWTLEEATEWLRQQVTRFTGRAIGPLERPAYDLPPSAIIQGERFGSPSGPELTELGAWYSNYDRMLRSLAEQTPGATPVRCWPHHFDIATLVFPRGGADAHTTPQIGVGLSPGDEQYSEPYVYVTPWPHRGAHLGALEAGGVWHRNGWVGALQHAGTLVAAGSSSEQRRRAAQFLESAVRMATEIVGAATGSASQ